MAQTSIKAAQFSGVVGNGESGQVLQSSGNGDMSWGSAGNTYTAGDGITLNTLEFDLDADLRPSTRPSVLSK